jgi:hypothetical protein
MGQKRENDERESAALIGRLMLCFVEQDTSYVLIPPQHLFPLELERYEPSSLPSRSPGNS